MLRCKMKRLRTSARTIAMIVLFLSFNLPIVGHSQSSDIDGLIQALKESQDPCLAAEAGYSLGYVGVLALMLMAINLPMSLKAHQRSRDSICVQNMKKIAQTIKQVSAQNNLNLLKGVIVWDKAPSLTGFGIVGEGEYFNKIPVCPEGGAYTAVGGKNWEVQMTCSGANHNTVAMYNGPGRAYFVLE